MRDLGFEPSQADPDVWMRAATKINGFKYYEYVLLYVDDILALGEHPEKVMTALTLCLPTLPIHYYNVFTYWQILRSPTKFEVS
jgi:hypothetical protein